MDESPRALPDHRDPHGHRQHRRAVLVDACLGTAMHAARIRSTVAMHAIEIDITDDTDISEECEFAERLLLAWAAWIYGADRLGCGTYSGLLELPKHASGGGLSLSEDQLLAIDRAIAQLPQRMRRLVWVHYCSSEDEPMTNRYRRLGLCRLEYRTRMLAVHSSLYSCLMPAVEQWRHSVL